jgi:hypothetical protein
MKTTTTLMLAFASLTLGAGSAMAQDGPSVTTDYWAAKNAAAMFRQAPVNTGNSVGNLHSFWLRSSQVQDGGTVGSDGSGG